MNNTAASAARYSQGAIVMHWLIALMIAANFVIAWSAEDLPKPERMALMNNHKALGLTILALTLLRLVWRATHTPPPLVETLKAWEAALAKVTHSLFYFLMVAIPVAGWGMISASAKGSPIPIFGMFDMPLLPVGKDKAIGDMFHESHEVLATAMLVLLGLHVLAALKHQFIDKDATARRMLPWLR